jgi:ribose transport system substrate-binding protein
MSHSTRRSRLVASATAVIAVLLAGLLLAACGSSNGDDATASPPASTSTTASSSGAANGVATAAANVKAAMKSPEFVAPPTFDPSPAKGKKVWIVSPQGENITHEWTVATKEALESQGVSVKVYDPGNEAANTIKGLELAVAAKPDAIIIANGYSPVQYSAQIAKAKAAGIPFFSLVGGSTPGIPPKVDGLTLDVSYDYVGIGRLLADWFIAESEGKGDVLLIETPDIVSSTYELDGFREEVEKLAPEAKVSTDKLDVLGEPDFGQSRIEELAQTAILKDPDLGFIIPAFDSQAMFAEAGVEQAGAADRVQLAGFNSIVPQMQALQKGDTPFKMDVGGVNEWLAYALADNVLREFSGVPLVTNPKVGVRVFTHENTQGLDVDSENDQNWYGVDYPAQYIGKVWKTK